MLRDLFAKLMAALFQPKTQGKDLAGPDDDEHPPVLVGQTNRNGNIGRFQGGLWTDARYLPAHSKRVGPTIVPRIIIVHTTDMHPSQWNGLLRNYTELPGKGECAHFALGRDQTQGVVQFVPITKNANHAGGEPHGWLKTGTGALIHPNTAGVGIEIHAPGLLRATGKPGEYVHPDSGLLVAPSDTYKDAKGRVWGKVTGYQLGVLRLLLQDLRLALSPMDAPGPIIVVPDASYASQGVADYAQPVSPTLMGHVSLDPINRMDPGPQVMDWLRSEALRGYSAAPASLT